VSEHSSYQRKVIQRYYENRGAIAVQKLSELVSELYLETSESKLDRLWERVRLAMANLGVPEATANHVVNSRDVAALARNVADWSAKPPPPG